MIAIIYRKKVYCYGTFKCYFYSEMVLLVKFNLSCSALAASAGLALLLALLLASNIVA